MIKQWVLRILNTPGGLLEQHWSMWVFIGWGWLSMLVLVMSFITTVVWWIQ